MIQQRDSDESCLPVPAPGARGFLRTRKQILPQLVEDAHAIDVVGMFIFEDNNDVLVQGDPPGERLAIVARAGKMLLMVCDPCRYERQIHDKPVDGATIGCSAKLVAGLVQNRPDQVINLSLCEIPTDCGGGVEITFCPALNTSFPNWWQRCPVHRG